MFLTTIVCAVFSVLFCKSGTIQSRFLRGNIKRFIKDVQTSFPGHLDFPRHVHSIKSR